MQITVRDYGVRAPDRFDAFARLLLLLVAGVGLAGIVYGNVDRDTKHRAVTIAEAKAWTITGAPCPSLAPKPYLADLQASGMHASRAFDFMGVTFARAYGHVSCAEIHENGGRAEATFPVCQFTSPAALEIRTARGQFYFFPSTGPATVSILDGRPECVRAGEFKG